MTSAVTLTVSVAAADAPASTCRGRALRRDSSGRSARSISLKPCHLDLDRVPAGGHDSEAEHALRVRGRGADGRIGRRAGDRDRGPGHHADVIDDRPGQGGSALRKRGSGARRVRSNQEHSQRAMPDCILSEPFPLLFLGHERAKLVIPGVYPPEIGRVSSQNSGHLCDQNAAVSKAIEDHAERTLRQRILDETRLPYVWIEIEEAWRLRWDRHPNAFAARQIALVVADRLRRRP